VFKEWEALTGGFGIGRPAAVPDLFGLRLDQSNAGLTKSQQLYWLMLVLLVAAGLAARNIGRSRVGRAFTAIRDRDLAAGAMGVNLVRYRTLAFGISSAYAGAAGALLFTLAAFVEPSSFGLLLSVQVLAMVLIGGAGTISGAIAGAFFITLLPKIAGLIRPPFVSELPFENPNIFQLETVIYGLLIVLFLLFEPAGLHGLWTRLRTFWKTFPFSH
jgi:branched-chain amino acid transport system permease protein